ncbi:hypothetical protein V3331_01480 [Gaopeijia maritima]|uniref:VPS10 domain-containing protein n=1 Tax=Gaopeijia maritima TaxID=3119007 RepID=UPI0032536193
MMRITRSLPASLAALAMVVAGYAPPAHAQSPSTAALDGLAPRFIGPAVMSGRIVDLAVVGSGTVLYAASSTGGVWKTVDGGVTWSDVFRDEGTHSVGDVAVHPRDTAVVWVGTGERASRQSSGWGDGVYKSTDGGESWTHMGLPDSKHIGRIRMHPDDPDIVFVAAMGHLWGPNEERGLYRSTDGGATWERVLHVDQHTGVVDVIMDPSDPSILYAASYQRERRPWGFHGGGPGSALWKSTDGGDTWTKLTNAGLENGLPTGDIGRIGIDVYASDPRIVYVSVEQGERYNASTAYEQRAAGIYRSEDRGETWEHMSDWNPRPMYASQITVDPNDDQRIYMVNSYSWSDDGGRTFTVPRQTLHGDDRLVWVDPANSDHVIKADDGGLGLSWNRGQTFIYVTNLPVSQWYRIGLDNSFPFRICGGLQDNGSWCGPSSTWRNEGILDQDWIKTGGGDGFRNVFDTTTNRILYNESQYLGLQRIDLVTGESKNIRPNQPEGFIGARRNWTTWPDLDNPEQRLGNAMPPGNWDGPFIISPHDPNTLYAGLDELFVSRDQGDSWTSLGDLTSGVDRRTLEVMGELPDSSTLSLDDGIPYYPTLTEIVESPFEPGVLYVGTDDGQVRVSMDGGQSWDSAAERVPGLPADAWINGIEASRHVAGRLYLVANNYRNDDYANYVWASEDHGESWTRIDGGLPAERVARTLREDPRNPDLLYLGTEIGLFVSFDRGGSWTELRAGMPTMAFNDLVIHPRDNDLVLATHSRGLFILDDVNALQELTAGVMASSAHLFSAEPAYQIRYNGERGHTGDMIFHGENPPAGAILSFWMGEGVDDASLTVHDAAGAEVAAVPVDAPQPGINRAVWNLRMALGTPQEARGGPSGPWVMPGRYTVRLTAGGVTSEQELEVRADPRLDVEPASRARWTAQIEERARIAIEAQDFARRVGAMADEVGEGSPAELREAVAELQREANELRSRAGRLRSAEGWIGPLSADEIALQEFVVSMLATLRAEADALEARIGG